MNLDRKLIKAQAKGLIKGKVMKLFITMLVIQLCFSAIPFCCGAIFARNQPSYNIFETYDDYFDSFDDKFNRSFDDYYDDYYDDYDDDYNPYEDNFENFGTENNSGKGDFYNFGTNFVPTNAKTVIDTQPKAASVSSLATESLSLLSLISEILLAPLMVTLVYYFVLFIRGKEFNDADGIKYIFKESFSNSFSKKIGVFALRLIIMYGLAIISIFILFIPMFIFYYSSYFAFEIMCDNPQLSPWQAIKISKKMIKGNRTELFVLELSFIPWAMLCIFIFPLIYVMPYVQTTKALYYENFRIRAMQQGRISEDDFLTDAQRMQKYANAGTYQPNANQQQGYTQANPYQYNGAGYYNPQQNNTYTAPQGNVYTAPQENTYTPPQENVYTAPQENTYTTPEENVYTPPQTDSTAETEPAVTEEEQVKPSEKYTPVTPPSESYNNSNE